MATKYIQVDIYSVEYLVGWLFDTKGRDIMIVDSGIASLISAVIAAVVAIVSLVVSIRTERERVRLESRLNLILGVEQEKRNLLYLQLSDFYDPIYSLLAVNRRIFERIGPNSRARWDRAFPEQETAEVWNKLVEKVINPNNLRICEIIQTKLHLLSPDDDVEPYMEFITHAYAYQVFREKPYESYTLFQFPQSFFKHVESKRNSLRQRIERVLSLKGVQKWL